MPLLKAQRVHHVSYLLAETIDLSLLENDTLEIFDLKAGYELFRVSLEVVEAGTGTLDLGITNTADYFLDNISLATLETYRSKRETTIKEDTTLTLNTTARDGVIRVRVLYFTEGTMYK